MKILKWIIAIPFVVLVLFVLARFAFCRPSYSVVKTATPMVEKMADYIVKHGMPDSLEQIPDLPYKLNECKKNIVYWTYERPRKIVKNKQEADYAVISEECTFSKNSDIFNVELLYSEEAGEISGDLDIALCKTSVGTAFRHENGKLISVGIGSNLDTRFGFCRPFKQ